MSRARVFQGGTYLDLHKMLGVSSGSQVLPSFGTPCARAKVGSSESVILLGSQTGACHGLIADCASQHMAASRGVQARGVLRSAAKVSCCKKAAMLCGLLRAGL